MTPDAIRRRLARYRPMPLSHIVGEPVPETPAVIRRRHRVVALTTLAGAGMLGISLSSPPGSRRFYVSTASVAATWIVGGAASGPLHLGWIESRDATVRRPIVTPVATGVGAFGVFYAGALISRRIPVLNRAVSDVLRYAHQGDTKWVIATTLANGIGEEVFFRGALYTAFADRNPTLASTATYALTTTTTRNPALVLAATVMGTLFGLQRRASGGIQAPALTHLTWSTLMVRYLPPLFR
ncbi:MAG: lysostaphin resistance A-like protein [Marmoricola sp.]